MSVDTEKLKALALAATPQDFDSAQIKREGGWADCPTCGGDGAVSLGKDYCNYDGAALGVQFYGVGDEHVKAEAYYRAANPATVLELIAKLDRAERALLRAGFQDLGGQEWKPPIGKPPIFIEVSAPTAGTEKDADRLLTVASDALEAMLEQFTRTPSTLADTTTRGQAHAALADIRDHTKAREGA